MKPFKTIPFTPLELDVATLSSRVEAHRKMMDARRSVRHMSDQTVPQDVIENLIRVGSSAPSGAHKQPWHFVAISDPNVKAQIRAAAEEEEKAFYSERAPQEWLEDLAPLGTDWEKEFLTTAPWLIVVFKKVYDHHPDGRKKNYYVQESVGIACGFLLQAIHNAGLVSLTHTPSPMNFLSEILHRPENEKPFLLIPVGYPAKDAEVPDIHRKDLSEVSTFI
ncbi:nitroreductase family protein [Phaeocystidibacter marisrubri]|uniref:Nitroreductase family protein n=1 Tax=Phaeocystidibacter marisrubri TaxID=1577780 RepID=A0A6L3ZBQ9_9FLAO|nr:nitroreductase family protein [Phaeocystidibacter marisrubri]KAB2815094.1 nitroreductase family protein [Phaeocystidibacter marisrubri]GGH70271.1 oxidoreductase [Phaeocystidibacter marisrubri]